MEIPYNQILYITTFKELKELLLKIPPRSLIVTDIDNVLVVHKDKILRSSSRLLYESLMQELKEDFCKKTKLIKNNIKISFFEYLHGKLIQRICLEPLDENMIPFLKVLRKQGHSLLALSQGKTGAYAEFNPIEDVRINQLKNLGFNFSESFKDIPPIKFKALHEVRFPVFKEGVILTSKTSKAMALQAFFDVTQKSWQTLIYIDDNEDWVKEMYNYFKNYMFVIGICYKNQKYLQELPDVKLARKQFTFLRNHQLWLTDAEINKDIKI
ncbi:MAG: DUF2608 domain-containing protein [Proteobacteria bacterium]|nr:DUF2608 domain-containing protein [Pseudomonadota bacterium]